ncbi:MotA/TolQ/ExbB proton channel family protein [Alkalihalobacillus sp. MEB130]|uniref:MotA/TolQ/ExbB proton channel family protein n=1 Tax=Alkalihalobacillus sp. MEB130 TaxID=2976704 RepID=UPI0028E07865|nr:MotA/TolQ/ExbB proton channel family protein [Alkalihalobacillus sp. MEB130]MDT8861142.1 MotA/TolQ/ExbB proton channel family protein [Alkalihalobacillus sp. MEB130]
MVEAILSLFTSEQQAQTILSNPLIETIFMVLFFSFAVTILIHFTLYSKLRRIRNYVHDTNSLDIAPLNHFQREFEQKNQEESVKVETFVQKKFSSWRVVNVPVVSLIKMIQMTVSVFILIGVLGTFIGLAMSLGSIDSTGDQLVENVAAVLGGIDVAFYTSIAGMGLSLIMTIVTRVANTEFLLTDIMLKTEAFLEEHEQDSMARLITVTETIHSSINELKETNQESLQSIVNSFRGFQEYTVGLQQSAKDLAKFNEGLSENLKDFEVIFTNVKEVTNGFDKGVSKLNKNFDQLFSYFYKMDQRNEKMTSAFTETYHKIAELTTSQMEAKNDFQQSVIDLKDFFTAITQRQEAIHTSFEKINGQSEQFTRVMKENTHLFERIFGEDVSSKLFEMNSYLRELRSDFHAFGHSVNRLPEAIETVQKAQGEYKNLLTYRFDELKQFNHEFMNQLQHHSTNSQAVEKYLSDATRSHEQTNMQNNQLLNELSRILTQMSDSFYQKDKQLESSVSAFKETVSKLATNVEGTMGDKLDKISRNISDYIIDMNEAIKKEFKQIGDITEENQQRSARYLQQTLNELSQEFQHLNRQLQLLSQDTQRQNDRVRVGTND